MLLEFICNENGSRLDTFISNSAEGSYTRSYFSGLISDGKVTVNGKVITKNGYKLSDGDKVTVDIPPVVDTDTRPEDIPLDVVYEDDDLIIINKPQGMVVHPAAGHHEGTEVVRQYRAVVYGVISHDKGTIDAPIGRANGDRRKMVVTENGKPSITHFEVVNRYTEATDLKLLLETGRTHQIRSHMTYIGHPVVADPLYAPRRKTYGLVGQCLHSQTIEFDHPRTGERISFSSDIPQYYKDLLDKLVLL